ncbi:hypothetical protein LB519_15240 [Mesorhizobium sp. AD1-1]|uniref:hypothetical protein n=1 Tax=Mesorhizobium sp. AD1-1 TaxID=2876621 RepID=UPI001CCF52FB|nr:hypothetical protein [Mesorhizobium sp. AD1-1]MBZ9719199.1 hypothetical protein [Mesorhizobium sp. AD1-1]
MTRLSIILAFITLVLPGTAAAQQEQSSQPEVSAEVRQMCKREVRKLCRTLLPTKAAIRRCVAENRDKLPEQCLAVFGLGQQ